MKRIAFFLFALLVCGNIWSQAATNIELFTIDDVVIEPNGTATIYVATKNLESYELKGGQFYIYLPAGISVNEITVYDEEAEEEVKYPDISLVGTYNKNNFSIYYTQKSGSIKFILAHTQKESVIKESKRFLKIGIKADANYPTSGVEAIMGGEKVGENYEPIQISSSGSERYVQDAIHFNVTVPLDEVKDYEAFDVYEGKVAVKRTINSGKWNTICLPFDIPSSKMSEVFPDNQITLATLDDCKKHQDSNGNVTGFGLYFKTLSTPAIEANTPYLIKVTSDVTQFVVNETAIVPIEGNPETSVSGCTFVGNYTYIKNLGENTPVLFLSNNEFRTAIGKTKLKSFRGYFVVDGYAEYHSAANVNYFVDEEQATEIVGLTTGQGAVDAVYDLQGRQVKVDGDLNSLQKGVYIVNGQKVTVK